MKFLHMADLHIGIHVNGFSMLKDQQYILEQVVSYIIEEQPDLVLIAGDIYNQPAPSIEAINIYDKFLSAISRLQIPLLVISGNHDSPERMSFASHIMAQRQIYVYSQFDGGMQRYSFADHYGEVSFHLLPFIRPANVRHFFSQAAINNYQDGVKTVIEAANLDLTQRNVLIAHQFISSEDAPAELSESEIGSEGGLDGVEVSLVKDFDYVALGHLHGPQKVGYDHIRYAGSLLKYSSSEWRQQKSVSLVELGPKGQVEIKLLPLLPLREMRKFEGSLEKLLNPENSLPGSREDYLLVTLTDKEAPPLALEKIRNAYPNVMSISFLNHSIPITAANLSETVSLENKETLHLFSDLFKEQTGSELTAEQLEILQTIYERTDA